MGGKIQNIEIIIFALVLVFNLAIIIFYPHPFQLDEGTYALMIKEFSEHPEKITPTITGEHVEWKPPLFFWIYSLFYYILRNLSFLPVETIFRLPSALFGALNALLLFKLGKQLYDEKTALVTVAIYVITPVVILFNTLTMMEALATFFFLTGAISYINKNTPLAVLSIILLSQVKWVYSLGLLVLMFIYFWEDKYRKTILLSIAFIPLSIMFHLAMASWGGSIENAAYTYMTIDINRISLPELQILFYNYYQIVIMYVPLSWFLIAMLLFIKELDKKQDRLCIFWAYLLLVMPLTGKFLYWYGLVTVPAIALLISRFIEKEDHALAKILLAGLVFISLATALILMPSAKSLAKDVQEIADLSNSVNGTTVFYTNIFISVWKDVGYRYYNTSLNYLLIEPHAPGFMFYRFSGPNASQQKVIFVEGGNISCSEGNLLIIDNYNKKDSMPVAIPNCFKYIKKSKNEEYIIYKKED